MILRYTFGNANSKRQENKLAGIIKKNVILQDGR